MLHYEVPFSSQYTDLGDHEWRARGCGIASLKMVMDFWHMQHASNQTTELDALLQKGLAIGAYREGVGWTHRGLVQLAQTYAYTGFNVDCAPQSPTPHSAEQTWQMLSEALDQGPVLASVYSGLDPDRGGGHIVVITGVQDGLVLFNDPEQLTAHEGRRVLALEIFLRGFKRRYIVIRPEQSDFEHAS